MGDKKNLRSNSVSSVDGTSKKNIPVSAGEGITRSEFLDSFKLLSEQIERLTTTLNTTIDSAIKVALAPHTAAVSNVVKRIESLEPRVNDLELLVKEKEITISGVPVIKNENLIDVFVKISATIGFSHDAYNCIDKIHRMPINKQYRNNSNISPYIVARFSTVVLKEKFLTQYFAFGKLDLRVLDFDSDKRVYVNHCLSRANLQIFHKARLLKKKGLLTGFFVRAGLVYIVRDLNERPTKAITISDLPNGDTVEVPGN